MKIFCILFFVFFLHVEAQRRSQTRHETTNVDPPIRGRGRSRFTNPETEHLGLSEQPSRRIPSRRRQDPVAPPPAAKPYNPPPTSSTPSYAVEEHFDEGETLPKSKELPTLNLEPSISPSKSSENEFDSAEISAEKISEEIGIPTVKIDTDRSSLFREDLQDIQPKLNERVVPITRNNVRNGNGAERRVDDTRNGKPRAGIDRGSRNGISRNTNENIIPAARNFPSRSRNENIASRRPSVIEDSGAITKQDPTSDSKFENSVLPEKVSDLTKDEKELRKQIVRNSMPNLPPRIGIASVLTEPPVSKKTVKKTIKTRVNTRNEETASLSRGRSNQRVVESFETAPRSISKTVEDFTSSSRGRPANEDVVSSRSKSSVTTRTVDAVTQGRSRVRATRKPETIQTFTISPRRGGRRRTDSSTTSTPPPKRGPSVFSTLDESASIRSRSGRRIEPSVPKVVAEIPQNPRFRGRGRGNQGTPDQLSSGTNRRQTTRSRNDDHGSKPRQRFNARSPLNIDESKLEVLPLFEGETKIVSDSGRKPNQLDELISTATESGNKVISPPGMTVSLSSDVSMSSKVTKMKVPARRNSLRRPEVKESVISQVTEVTSKKTITRKPIVRPGGKRLSDKKPLDNKLNGLTSSEENISDSDNYPEPFKALIQSKKQVKESRPFTVPEEDNKSKKIVSGSSSTSPRSVLVSPSAHLRSTTYPVRYSEDLDNEIQPKPSTSTSTFRPTKKRLSPSFKNLEIKSKKSSFSPLTGKTVSRTTSAPLKETKEHKFHSKFSTASKNKPSSTAKPFVVGTAKSLSRKYKDGDKYTLNKTKNVADSIRSQSTSPPANKIGRYSARYRSNGASRSVTRTTAPPAYIPTIPSVRSYNPTVKPKDDPELGLEYITYDIPSRGISSANLIKGDYQGSEDSNSLDTKREKGIQTTEKPVSIIERIINSITGINITTEPTSVIFAVPSSTPEPTKSSAILSLAPKKTEKTSRTDDSTQHKLKSNKRDAATSEKPTTIIQRILDSLSAIQAATTTETTTVVTTDNPKQVGTNFNTLSVRTTTPSNLDLETASFSSTLAQSTTINPLVVLDTISDEQVLQKRTIGKLLDILNSLTTQHPDSNKLPEPTKLVYVTPKLSNFLYATPLSSSGTLKPLTEQLMTSISSFTESSSTTKGNTDTLTGTETASTSTTTDSPLSISLIQPTTPFVENDILYSTTPRTSPIVMNIKNLLALNDASTTKAPILKTTLGSLPSGTSLFTPAKSTTTQTTTTLVSSMTPEDTNSATPNSIPSNDVIPTSTTISSTEDSLQTESSTIPESILTDVTTLGTTDTPETTSGTSSIENIFSYFSTVPSLPRFEVSPESVSIFSANDLLSNSITPDDFLTSTISIPGRVPESFSLGKTTYPTDKVTNTGQNSITKSLKTTISPAISTFKTQTRLTTTPIETVATTEEIRQTSTTPSTDGSATNMSAVTTDMPVNISNISPPTSASSITTPGSGRAGKLLQNPGDEVSNNIDSSSMGPDYFIFAVLPNNTILRKRPVVYSKETPFVIVGVYPNNTIIRKYPNGTIIPMEPVIAVSGFDTRANPPPLPDITSNQVTPDKGNEPDNPKLEMVSTNPTSTVNSLISSTNVPEQTPPTTTGTTSMMDSTTVESVTKEALTSSNTVIPDNVISSTTLVPSTTLPSITELLNGKIVQAFNNIVNNTSTVQDVTPKVDDNAIRSSTIATIPSVTVTSVPSTIPASTGYPSFLSTLITTLQSIGTTGKPIAPTTQTTFRYSSTYRAPLSTITTVPTTITVPTTTTRASTTRRMTSTSRETSTTRRITTTTMPPTTTLPSTTTVPPTLLPVNTLKVEMQEVQDTSTPPPFTSKPAVSTRNGKALTSSTVFPYFNPSDFPLLSFLSTERSRRTNNVESSTTPKKTTIQESTLTPTTENVGSTTESLEELLKKPIDSIKPKRKLTEQQKQDLEMIRRLENEQAAILKQLSLLTNLNLNNLGSSGSTGNLANRIISLAKERDSRKTKSQNPKPTTTVKTTTTTTEQATTVASKSEEEAEKERMRQIESLIKLLNMNGVTPSPNKGTTYGTTNDAILASLLKERGIGPSTPKQLAEQLEQSGFYTTNEVTPKPKPKSKPTTRRPKTTIQPTRGPLLQRLNWLLDAFAPAPTKPPTRKPKTTTMKPKPKVVEEDILTNEPTHITPVVSPPLKAKKGNTISQDDIQKLIKQLEAIQRDPSAAKNLDLTSFKNLQTLNKDNVQVFIPGSSGVSERDTTRPVTRAISQRNKVTTTEALDVETTTKKKRSGTRAVRTSTSSPVAVSNSLEDDDEVVTASTKGRVTLPPVRLRPVSGVSDDAGAMVRGRLLTAAVNVTRAISGFLGSAFQEAVRSVSRSLSRGSLANIAGSSIPISSSNDEDYPLP